MDKAKNIAIKAMQDLNIYSAYINGFKKSKQRVCFFENCAGFWVDQEQEIHDKMKDIENKYNVLVYAITHEKTEFGELWDFLCVPEHEDSMPIIREYSHNSYFAFAYVWNKDYDACSEFGEIVVKSFGGGIMRIH